MKVTLTDKTARIPRTDLLVIPVFTEQKPWLPAGFKSVFNRVKDDMSGEFRNTLLLYPDQKSPDVKRLLLLGAGEKEKFTTERLRRLSAMASNEASRLEAGKFVFRWDSRGSGLAGFSAGAALAEGALLAVYKFDKLKKAKSGKKEKALTSGTFLVECGSRLLAELRSGFKHGLAAARGQNLARLVGDTPANMMGPAEFASQARSLARRKGFRCSVLNEKQLEQLGMDAFLGVGRGSAKESKMVVLQTNPTARRSICIVGKGVTFDSGGISIKPSAGMWKMRYDMLGAAAVLGLFEALDKQDKLPWNVVGIMGLAENMPGPNAQRPGDVVKAMDGTTIEVLNTDAEGRLVLADCIAWAGKKLKPKPEAIVDLATLTGACLVALGMEAAGLLATNDGLAKALLAAGEETSERCWQLPMWDEYRDLIKGSISDLQNIGKSGSGAGTITAGAFLAHFAKDIPFAHLDIAYTSDGGRARDYYKTGAHGFGVRLLLRFLQEKASPWRD